MKRCSSCDWTKPYSDFHKRKASPDGYRKQCKSCRSVKARVFTPEMRKQQRDKAREAKLFWIEEKGGKCADCGGVFHQCQYDFHHLDETLKTVSPGQMFNLSVERQIQEMENLVLLCACCHRLRHWED